NILKEKEEAIRKEEEERKKRIEAEQQAKHEAEKRAEAERKQKEEEEKRRKAELDAKVAELKRREEQIKRKEAEQKAKEEEEKRKDYSDKLDIETKKNQYLNATRKTLSEDAEQLVHSIDLYVGNASTYVNDLLATTLDKNTIEKIYSIKNNIDKAIKVSQIIIKSNFDYKHTKQRINLPLYIHEYIEDLSLTRPNIKFKIEGMFDK